MMGIYRVNATTLPFRNWAFPAVSDVDVLGHVPPIRECVRVASCTILYYYRTVLAAELSLP